MRRIIRIIGWTTLCLILAVTLAWPRLSGYWSAKFPNPNAGTIVRLYHHSTGQIEIIPLEDYIVGVVAAEMPADFPVPALMAQAVAARTYIYKRMMADGVQNRYHPGADTCDDHQHAQAYISSEEMKKRWGLVNYYRYYYKIRQAVDACAGEIITYQGQPIDPVYHASCGGRTENSEDVWKFAVPYLRSVNCPYHHDPQLVQEVAMPVKQVEKKLGVDLGTVAATTGGKNIVQVTESTFTGRPKTLIIGDFLLTATDIRSKLNLRSTNFTCTLKDDQLIFRTIGYGHGVGLCQYGAKGLAENGYDYKQIIKHYYTDVEVGRQTQMSEVGKNQHQDNEAK